MLTVKNGSIIDPKSRQIFLHGVNLGGWLMMEGYILHGRNIAERVFKSEFKKRYGGKELEKFTRLYRNSFIQELDFKNISSSGFNCIRLPFNYRILEEKGGLKILKDAVRLCKKYNIYCILDMHAAPGCQNQDWHADSDGKAGLWTDSKSREMFFNLWEMLADEFKEEDAVAGYDILNEPVIKTPGAGKTLRDFYVKAVRRIRKIDKNHIIFLEGNIWSQVLEHIGEPFAKNLSYSVHFYHPLEFTFNFEKGLRYPGRMFAERWDISMLNRRLEAYRGYSSKWDVPIFVGEFGVNSRDGFYGELKWVEDILKCFNEHKFHWTYWTYKAIANSVFPDGIYRYLGNLLWVNRQGPVYGFENFYTLWESHKKEITKSWETPNFTKDKQLLNLLASFNPI